MAERMSTATRMDRARANGKLSRIANGHLKRKERTNRDKKMVELIKKGPFPYTPSIQSWVSEQLGKPFTQVTEAEASQLASGK
jgi:hypothetical protein